MRQVQEVVAVGFAALLGLVLVSVLLDAFGVDGLFAAARAGAGEDGPLVVPDQGNQAGQGGRVAVPGDRDVAVMFS